MANTYKGILTNNGKALIANATVNNKINYSHIAVGDGNGSVPTPSETRPALINEKVRIALNVVEINPNNTNQIVCEAIIPTNTGGFYIRELGLYAGNTMVVNASYPPTYKPLADEGGAREIAIKIVINIQNAEVIALYLDDSLIYATREWVNNNYIRRNEIVDNLTTDDSKKPLSAKQGKVLNEKKVEVGKSFSDSFSKDVDYYQDHLTEQTFKSFDDFPLGSRVLVSKNINLLNTPNIVDDFIYIETKTTYKKSAPGRHQFAIGYSTGEIAVRSASTNANYSGWSYLANTQSNVASATKLQSLRKIFGQSFDGTADVVGNVTTSTGMVLADTNHFIDIGRAGVDRMNFNVYGGVFNFIDAQTGNIVARLNPNGIDCNAITASKLQSARKINDIDFDGTKDINISAPMRELTAPELDKALDDGFYICGGVNIAGLYPYGILETRRGANGTINQTYYAHMGDFRVAVRQAWDGGQEFSEWLVVGLRANTASRLETSRTVSFSGAATGSFSYDGSANSSCILTLSNSGVVAGIYASTVQIPSITVNEKGQITGISQQTIRSASVTQTGIVQLVDNLASDDSNKALTAKQGKALFDSKLSKSTQITSGNLNNYQEPGLYWCSTDAEAATILNVPTPYAFALFVERHAGTKQTFTEYNTNRTFIRRLYAGAWTSWKEIAFTDNQTFTGNIKVDGPIYAQNFRNDGDFWFVSKDGGAAKRLLTGGLLVSDAYVNADQIPDLGIYSKGNILTSGGFFTTRAETTISNSTGRYLFINQQKWGAFDPATGYVPLSVDCGGTGNGQGIAPSASKLQIARKINNVLFDGTGDIDIAAPMRYLGTIISSTANNAINDGFYLVADDNGFNGLYGYGVLEVRSAGGSAVNQTYYAHQKNSNGSVIVRQSWNNGQNFTPWRSLDPQGSVTLSGQLSGSGSFDDSGNLNISASVVQGLGINQTWRNVTSQRAANTTYTNNRAVPIKVAIYLEAGGNNAYANISVGGEFLFAFSNTTAWGTSRGGEITVPPNTTYRVDGTFSKWSELT
ncbi:phage tail-collar fiber domain-containing protein [Acinetobacter bereziniae]|uniref:phage tail-collar fiber domain-containing protein n=1 Tax=Acinetobacter bereziniae TaxID=106648 RepID=UPI0021E4BA80|nr:phage tail protein [Acinetobacter bereziniae]MCV2441892.1 phage tail protein [Acinetobacter bereziniae]